MSNLRKHTASVTSSVIVYGAPKSGKSLLAGKLAEHFKLLWVDMENGHETLFQLPEAWQDNIELINLKDTRSFPIAIETCLKMVKGATSICEEHGKVGCMICKRAYTDKCKSVKEEEQEDVYKDYFIDTNLPALDNNTIVVFDSLTQLTNSAIAHITKGTADDYKLDYDDWGNLGKLLDIFLSHLQQASYNVVVISHETEAETEGKKKTLVPVGGTRNFSRNVAKYFGHVVYAERKNKKHVFSSSSTYATTILTGSRRDIALEDSAEPSLLAIFKPELYAGGAGTSKDKDKEKAAPTYGNAVKASTADILARLKAKKK